MADGGPVDADRLEAKELRRILCDSSKASESSRSLRQGASPWGRAFADLGLRPHPVTLSPSARGESWWWMLPPVPALELMSCCLWLL